MIRHIFGILVASTLLISCNNSTKSHNDNWNLVYQNALNNKDYNTAVVALNHLIITDTTQLSSYYDSLSVFYIKKLRNYDAGQKITDKGLVLNPNNAQLLEFKSVFLSAEGKIEDARKTIMKAFEISKKNKHLYMYATTYATEGNLVEYSKIVNGILYNPNYQTEMIEVTVDENNSQYIDLKSLCYLDKAKTANNPKLVMNYIDSALNISPNYEEAIYYKNKLSGK
jgi:tetratricopeptide (TPR) repeat protein